MKKRLFITIVVFVLLSMTALAAYASGNIDLWQVGKPDGAVNPIDGSAEYPATGAFTATYDYYVGSDSDPINSPSMPGYIGPANVCNFAGGRPCTDTTAELNINFDLACSYDAGELSFIYDRYGSESDNLYLDDVMFATISATEGGFRQFSFDLGNVSVGSHTLKIEYAGGGSGNGHYIDYFKLDSTKECPIAVDVDIKPGSDPNCFNNDGNGVIPVAIMGSSDFDVTQINGDTLQFGSMAVAARGKDGSKPLISYEDWSGDGFTDLLVKFEDSDGVFEPGDGTGTVSGSLVDGTPFEGQDSICVTQ